MKQNLSKHDQAIHEYLESLLMESQPMDDDAEKTDSVEIEVVSGKPSIGVLAVTDELGEEALPHEDPVPPPVVMGIEQLVSEIPDPIVRPEIKIEAEVKPDVETEIVTEIEEKKENFGGAQVESEVPEWGQGDFQCLLFNVSGLSLAVPLVKLSSVIPWDENITQTPNQTEWYLGLVKHLEHQVKVIDTALLVMPENRRGKIETDSVQRLGHILLVDDYQWGLACDSIGDVIWLNKDDVKWRKNKTSRAWLSGTSLEHLCAIMDTEVFARLLTQKKI